mgnify:CR=1 FL=1
MTNDQKTPVEISEDDLDGVQGAGAKGIVLSSESEEPAFRKR